MIVALPALLLAAAPVPQPLRHSVIRCTVETGETAEVTAMGDELIYTFGGRRSRAVFAIVGSVAAGNVRRRTGRYAGAYEQLRFFGGGDNYILWSMDANATTGTPPSSGLVVIRNGQRQSDRPCTTRSWFDWGPFRALGESVPEDDESNVAM